MNANQLADELENNPSWIQDEILRKWVVDMLRKQTDDLEHMQQQFDKAIDFLAKCNGWNKK
jgi:hypothetical protein